MATKANWLKDVLGNILLPKTYSRYVYDEDSGDNMENTMAEMQEQVDSAFDDIDTINQTLTDLTERINEGMVKQVLRGNVMPTGTKPATVTVDFDTPINPNKASVRLYGSIMQSSQGNDYVQDYIVNELTANHLVIGFQVNTHYFNTSYPIGWEVTEYV